ncbi:MAG: F420-dependent methylenetetrahydromethanopterin dehydrogenase [Candidatus Syntrophoarchaeum sp. WYZ-LMO15]|nr:MAG: F420-dependent methylenetetrahydromethanopterin dehydrogenase [Candidatus Syntrophoarchaeum sp. WYZ-LMO15]
MVKVGFIKLGNIGMSLIVNLLLDERADREDIDVRVAGTGAKMGKPEAEDVLSFLKWEPDLLIVTSPNAALPGPKIVREAFEGKPCIVISDGPAKKAVDEMKEKGFGYIILPGDPMIGARREFLDPTEMALFNTDVLKVLSVSGAARLVQEEIDRVIGEIKAGGKVTLPQIIATAEVVTQRAQFSNPYARAKAIAAYSMAEKVAELDAKACFAMKDPEAYTLMVAAAHEIMREAARLADEARELEKAQDAVSRAPHGRSGEILSKRGLMEPLK